MRASKCIFKLMHQIFKRFGFWFSIKAFGTFAILYSVGAVHRLLHLAGFLLSLLTQAPLSDLYAWMHHIYRLVVERVLQIVPEQQ